MMNDEPDWDTGERQEARAAVPGAGVPKSKAAVKPRSAIGAGTREGRLRREEQQRIDTENARIKQCVPRGFPLFRVLYYVEGEACIYIPQI